MIGLAAITFAAPWIAWSGLALAAGPVVIHLLNRRKVRRVEWAAMRFLLESRQENRRRLRLEELLLLAMRCVLMVLIALAVARPRVTGGALAGMEGAGDYVFVVDDSASMGLRRGAATNFSAALEQVRRQIEGLGREDRAAIYFTSDASDGGEAFVPLGRVEDKAGLRRMLEQRSVSDTRGGLAESLAGARKALAGRAEAGGGVVHVLSDLRLNDWSGGEAVRVRSQAAGLAEQGARLVVMDFGGEERANLGIERLELLDATAMVNADARLAVTVANHGEQSARDVRLRLSVGGVELPVRVIGEIAAGGRATVEAACVFPAVGRSVVRASLPGDALDADNVAQMVVEVREGVSVLIVDGDSSGGEAGLGEAYFLRAALDPLGDGSFGVRPDVVGPGQLFAVRFEDYDLVVLAGVTEFPGEIGEGGHVAYPLVDALERYVAGGGGLAIFTGERVNTGFYNGRLFADGAGLVPLKLGEPAGDSGGRGGVVRFMAGSAANVPMLRAFHGEGEAFARLVRFHKYHRAEEPSTKELPEYVGAARVLMRFDDAAGSPAIAERRFGKGRVMLVCSTAGGGWNDWGKAVTMTFVPVMNDMAAYLAKRPEGNLTGLVGEAIDQPLSGLQADSVLRIKTPGYPEVDVEQLSARADSEGARSRAYFDTTRWAGIYELTIGEQGAGSERLLFARNVDAAEGDLRKADRGVVAGVLGGADFVLVAEAGRGAGAEAAGALGGRELWKMLLGAALVLMVVETVLSRRFGHHEIGSEAGG